MLTAAYVRCEWQETLQHWRRLRVLTPFRSSTQPKSRTATRPNALQNGTSLLGRSPRMPRHQPRGSCRNSKELYTALCG